MGRALQAEILKLRRVSLLLWSAVAVFVAPTLSNVFAVAQQTGAERPSWPGFFALSSMTMGTWYGVLLFGLVTAFLFGREYVDGTASGMLSTPIRREYVVFAKLTVLAAWVLSLSVLALVAQAGWATALGLAGFAWASVWPVVGDVLTVALLQFLTLPVIALVAVVSRGIFAPMIVSAFGFSAGMLGGIAGWGEWLPWAMPAAIGGTFMGTLGSDRVAELTLMSWVISGGVFVAGTVAIMWWLLHADNSG